jgi:hypothetical protein
VPGNPSRTIPGFETGKRKPVKATLAAIQRALESAGVELADGGRQGEWRSGSGKK